MKPLTTHQHTVRISIDLPLNQKTFLRLSPDSINLKEILLKICHKQRRLLNLADDQLKDEEFLLKTFILLGRPKHFSVSNSSSFINYTTFYDLNINLINVDCKDFLFKPIDDEYVCNILYENFNESFDCQKSKCRSSFLDIFVRKNRKSLFNIKPYVFKKKETIGFGRSLKNNSILSTTSYQDYYSTNVTLPMDVKANHTFAGRTNNECLSKKISNDSCQMKNQSLKYQRRNVDHFLNQNNNVCSTPKLNCMKKKTKRRAPEPPNQSGNVEMRVTSKMNGKFKKKCKAPEPPSIDNHNSCDQTSLHNNQDCSHNRFINECKVIDNLSNQLITPNKAAVDQIVVNDEMNKESLRVDDDDDMIKNEHDTTVYTTSDDHDRKTKFITSNLSIDHVVEKNRSTNVVESSLSIDQQNNNNQPIVEHSSNHDLTSQFHTLNDNLPFDSTVVTPTFNHDYHLIKTHSPSSVFNAAAADDDLDGISSKSESQRINEPNVFSTNSTTALDSSINTPMGNWHEFYSTNFDFNSNDKNVSSIHKNSFDSTLRLNDGNYSHCPRISVKSFEDEFFEKIVIANEKKIRQTLSSCDEIKSCTMKNQKQKLQPESTIIRPKNAVGDSTSKKSFTFNNNNENLNDKNINNCISHTYNDQLFIAIRKFGGVEGLKKTNKRSCRPIVDSNSTSTLIHSV